MGDQTCTMIGSELQWPWTAKFKDKLRSAHATIDHSKHEHPLEICCMCGLRSVLSWIRITCEKIRNHDACMYAVEEEALH